MREIITLQIGGCGNAIGEAFWQLISCEHGVDYYSGQFVGTSPLQIERINVFFNYTASRRFYARTLCVDTDSGKTERLCASSQLYRPDNCISGRESAGNSYARGYHTDGKAIVDSILDKTRLEAENVDKLQGFQILHSIGGGTGSGLTALVMESLIDEYPDNLISNYVVLPSHKISNVVVEPYNAVLGFASLIHHSHLTFCLDNEALYNICSQNFQFAIPNYEHTNHLVALAMSGITTCLRFPGQLNSGLRKIYVNMVPFPTLHFLIPGFAPILSCSQQRYAQGNLNELVQQLFSPNNMLCAIDLKQGKVLTAAGIFRGRMSPLQVDTLMTNLRNKNISNFVEWIPNNIKTAICDIPPRGLKMAATFIGNTSASTAMMKRILNSATVMFNRKAHLHWYTGEGMEEQELQTALELLQDLINDYKTGAANEHNKTDHKRCPYCNGVVD